MKVQAISTLSRTLSKHVTYSRGFAGGATLGTIAGAMAGNAMSKESGFGWVFGPLAPFAVLSFMTMAGAGLGTTLGLFTAGMCRHPMTTKNLVGLTVVGYGMYKQSNTQQANNEKSSSEIEVYEVLNPFQ